MTRVYILVTEELRDGKRSTTDTSIEVSADYNFDQLGEIVRDMADSIRGSTKEEIEQKRGEAQSDMERGN